MNYFLKLIIFELISLVLIQALTEVKMKVSSPIKLKEYYKQQNVHLTLANYGYVPYGKNLAGNIHMANPFNACSNLTSFNTNQGQDPAGILLIIRGQCKFVTKTKYAQLIGAQMVIIIDTFEENEENVIMIDDGLGKDIHIPTLMISKQDGDVFLQYLNNSNPEISNSVKVQFSFQMPQKTNKVDYEYWLSSIDEKSYPFILNFKETHLKLEKYLNFRPRYALWYCIQCKNQNYTLNNDLCVSGGRYCAPDPDSTGPLKGRDVVLEDLRQICIFNHAGDQKWWIYQEKFYQNCLNERLTTNLTQCSLNVQNHKGINQQIIQQCVKQSFVDNDIDGINDNSLLSIERTKFIGEGIQIWPSLIINNITYRGNLVPCDGVHDAICQGFNQPIDECKSMVHHRRVIGGLTTGQLLAIIIPLLCVFMVFMLFVYKRMIRRDQNSHMQLLVNTKVSQYMALNDKR